MRKYRGVMMKKIVECVPNFSEGRNQETIEAIAQAITAVEGCQLLDVDPGASTNRTVFTFVGDPESIIEGALAGARVAHEHIDMQEHRGEHPRFGAMDVCPFVPVAGVTMDECVELARSFASRMAKELGVALYLYEEAAELDYRKKLPDIRYGEYEGLEEKLKDPRWKPDFGPAEFDPQWGVTATGARKFLLAYNVNILGTPNQAHRIALNIREAGRGEDDPGRLQEVKGMGWFVKEYNLAQVTVNITDYHVTPLHMVFEEVKKEAELLNVGIVGSELVGLVPREVLLMAGEYYKKREKLFIYQEDQLIRLAVERLGLNSIAPFDPKKRIIEEIIAEAPDEPLASMSLRSFIEEVGSRSSAPGGGSVSAVVAAAGVALGAMVSKLTHGVRKFEKVQRNMEEVIPLLHQQMLQLIPMIDADTTAFNEYMEGIRMPKDSQEQRRRRSEKMQSGLKSAVEVPLDTMRMGDAAWEGFEMVARYGNPASRSDTQVGARALEVGIWGAYQNVLINLTDIEDGDYCQRVSEEAAAIAERARVRCAKVLTALEDQ